MRPNLPQLTTAVIGWADHIMVGLVCKSQENFKTVESILTKRYKAVLQPLQTKQLMILPEGQRAWKWYQLHADPTLQLEVDDIVILDQGYRYRVMGRKDYSAYGYMEYELVRGYENL
jgi:hypothetical protein